MPAQPLNLSSVAKPTPSALPLFGGSSPVAQTPVAPKSILQKGVDFASNYAQESAAIVPTFGQSLIDSVLHPIQAVKKIGNLVAQPYQQGTQQAGDALYKAATTKNMSTPEKVANISQLLSGIAAAGFSPITGAFNLAEKIPGAKQVADTLNLPFQALGSAGSWSTGTIVDHLPIDQASKDIIKQPLQDLGSLATQVVFGGKVMERISTISRAGTKITPEVTKTIVDQVKAEVSPEAPTPSALPLIPKTPEQLHAEYAKSQGYEPYTLPDQLPTIDAGTAPKDTSGLPAIQTEAPTASKVKGDFTIEPIKQATPDLAVSFNKLKTATDSGDTVAAQATLKDIQTKVTDLSAKVEAQSAPKTSGVAERVNKQAVEAGLAKSGYDENLAKYEGTTDAVQAKAVSDAYSKGVDHIISILRGSTELPSELRPGALVRYTEQFIKENPKDPKIAELSHALANSQHTGAFSQAGSDLRAGRGFADSATGKLEEIKKARQARAGESAVKRAKSVPKEAKKSMKKVNLSQKDLGKLQDFIDRVTC